jgi:hypothetical protein
LAEKARKKEAEIFPSPCLDVVASYKISLALKFFPLSGIFYFFMFGYFIQLSNIPFLVKMR